MHLIFDNLIALVVSGIIIMTLSTSQIRSQHAAHEQIVSHSVKAKTLVFGNWVEQDVLGLGANFGDNLYRFESPVIDAAGNTQEWVFYSDSLKNDGSVIRIHKRYTLDSTRSVTFTQSGQTFQLYEVHRDVVETPVVDGVAAPPDWSNDLDNNGSLGTLSFFRIEMLDRLGKVPYVAGTEALDASGSPIPGTAKIDVEAVDYIRVRFGVVPEYVLRPDNYIREMYWVRTLKVRPYWTPPPTLSNTTQNLGDGASAYDADGYDADGYDVNGYDRDGYDRDGWDADGYGRNGRDADGYDRDGNR